MNTMIRRFLLPALLLTLPAGQLSAHCQIPCGIYDDDNVLGSMRTDVATIEKACTEIDTLAKDCSANAHQLTRWIVNKESHAQDIQDKVLNYFLAQRLKADAEGYVDKLKLCHEIIVTAMKCKQSTDAANVKHLHELMHQFEEAFGTKKE